MGEPIENENVKTQRSPDKNAHSFAVERFMTCARSLKLLIKENFPYRIAGYGIAEIGNRPILQIKP